MFAYVVRVHPLTCSEAVVGGQQRSASHQFFGALQPQEKLLGNIVSCGLASMKEVILLNGFICSLLFLPCKRHCGQICRMHIDLT